MDQAAIEKTTNAKRAVFVRGASLARRRQGELIQQSFTQNLTWDIIYIVAHGHFEDYPVFVTDVCHSVNVSKSTVIKAIDGLVRSEILARETWKNDKRRRVVKFTVAFAPMIESYIDESITLLSVE